MIQDKNPARAAAVLGAAVLAVLGIVACQRESAPPPLAAAGNAAAAAAPTPAASPADPHAAAPASAPGTSAGMPAAAGSGPVPGEPVTSELRRAPQSVKVGDAPPSPAPAPSGKESELAARERRLAARVAALEAREKQLRQKDQAASASSPPTTPGAPSTPATSSTPSDTALPGDQNAAAADPAASLDAAAAMSPGPAGPAPAGANDGAGSPAGGGGAATGAVEPPPWPSSEGAPRGPVSVPAGTSFEVEFTKGLASNTSSVGQTFRARLLSDVRLDGTTAIPAGSEILGVVTEAVAARRIGGQAKLSLKITDLVLPSGSTVPIHASFLEEGKSKTGRDAATIGGAAAGGGLLGRILGRSGKGTILGALVGAAVGTAIAARTAGEEVVIPEGSVVKLKLDETLEIKVRR
jgi:hypothetical protein